jgi:cholesterol transport system auxiliary component
MRIWTIAAWVFVLTASGCFSPRGDALPVHTYQLSVDGWSDEGLPVPLDGPVLLVSLPQAEPGFETPRMVYVTRRFELEYYAANQWAESPARLFSPLLVQSAGRTGDWRAVVASPSSIRGDYRLDVAGFAVQQEFLQQPSRVRLTLRSQLVDLKESRVVSTKTFEAVAPAPSEDAYGGVLAANQATAMMLTQVTSWLQSCVRHTPECNR